MSEECTHDCSTCSQHCGHANPEDLIEKLHPLSSVKHVYGVVSGKGGVGKSIVTSMLAASIQRQGYRTAILDADITGPSIPKMFGVKGPVEGIDDGILAKESKFGTQIMSVNLLLDEETRPVVWRGPVIAGTVKQFWTEVVWKDVDYMFVDMPPGTGDVPLTVFQSMPVEGLLLLTSPEGLVAVALATAVTRADLMDSQIVGLIENMSYFKCPDCGKEYKIFGDSHISEIADANGLDVLARIPIDPELAKVCDAGAVELFEGDYLAGAVTRLLDGKK